MRKSAATFITFAFALAAAAQQTGQCISPELMNGLVFNGRSEMRVRVVRGQAAFMSDVVVPATLTLIGYGVREGGMTSVAYKTALGTDKAYSAIVAALAAEGWVEEATQGSSSTFSVAGSPKDTTLCRNAERRHVMVSEVAGVRYVHLMTSAETRRPCNAGPAPASAYGMMRSAAAPRFHFPAGTTVPQSGGGGGSDSLFTTTSRIISTQAPGELVEYLAGQMEQQGWQQDSRWSGAGSAGSTWRKEIDGEPASGTLGIIRVSEATYDIEFTTALPQ